MKQFLILILVIGHAYAQVITIDPKDTIHDVRRSVEHALFMEHEIRAVLEILKHKPFYYDLAKLGLEIQRKKSVSIEIDL